MFGRRRRHPVLGTAVVIGASRASARREVERQTAVQAQQASEIERSAEAKRRQEEAEELRIQKAVEGAIAKASFGATAVAVPGASARLVQAGQPLVSPSSSSSTSSPTFSAGANMNYPLPSVETPENTPTTPQFYNMKGPADTAGVSFPAAASSSFSSSQAASVRYCPACGNACELSDDFCRKCGRKQT